ncbi:MAG: glycosyltransferase family 2 protein [Lachnospiraceae bacterium]|nr:glycosyltransferase family 2 protein [Lachnospiraceae bacterium]
MITVVSMVKNAADVIEVMMRANSLIADSFVIIAHDNNDRTDEILDLMVHEGFKIRIIRDNDHFYNQNEKMMRAIKLAVEEFHPDFILPLDDDEIICSDRDDMDHLNIKESVSGLDGDNLYYVSWRNYIPTEEDDQNERCITKREQFCFDDEPYTTKKVLIPFKIATAADFRISMGNHDADSSIIRNRVNLKDLRIAHYPIRSAEQVASKALVGWMNYLTMPNKEPEAGYHWQRMAEAVKSGGLPSIDMMQAMCTLYREYPNDTEHLNIIKHPLNLPDECTNLKYTSLTEVNALRNVYCNAESIAREYASLYSRKKV